MNIFKITEEEKRRILNSHRSASIVKEQEGESDDLINKYGILN